MFTTAAKNKMLDALVIDAISLHSAFPGGTGASEFSGGGYARVACTFAAGSGGARLLTAASNLTVPTGQTVRWAGFWEAGVYRGCAANAGVPKEFFAVASTDVVTCPAHGYVDTNKVVFYADTVPAGLTEGTVYFVRDATVDTFKVAATAGGAAIDLTSAGGAGCLVSVITEELYGGGGTHTINSWTLGLPH